jgi:phosphate-selective porin OprO and OprP
MRKSVVTRVGLCLLALMLGVVASASAQVSGLYYKEVEKDGRIYVFNTPEAAQAFEASGEMGRSVTLVGRAEGGKTLVAENETAADLYLFKHNLPGYDRPTPKPERLFDDRVFYRDGRTNIVMKTGTVQISNRVQARYTLTDPEVGDEVGSFRIRRMKTTIEGSLANAPWRFKLQANWVGTDYVTNVSQASNGTVTQTRRRGPLLEDAEVWYTRNPMATVWMGQGKAFFGRQELTSSGRQQFVDRSIVSERFAPARQIGLGLIGANVGKTFEYNLGVYNGGSENAINTTANDNKEYMTVARLAWTPLGEYRLEESSLDYPTSPKLLLAGAYLDDTRGTGTAETDITRYGLELGFKYQGLNFLGEYYTEESERVNAAQVDTDGFYAQLGYLFPNKKFEIAARLAEIAPDTTTPQDRTETGIAGSWYWDKHNHKLQADYRKIEDDRTGAKDNELRIQLQLIF